MYASIFFSSRMIDFRCFASSSMNRNDPPLDHVEMTGKLTSKTKNTHLNIGTQEPPPCRERRQPSQHPINLPYITFNTRL